MSANKPPADSPAKSSVRESTSEEMVVQRPTPDFESLQRAYVRNVERLEDRADPTSLGTNIGDETSKIQGQHQSGDVHPTTSASNRVASDGKFTQLYNQMTATNDSTSHLEAVRIPSDSAFHDVYDQIANEIQEQLRLKDSAALHEESSLQMCQSDGPPRASRIIDRTSDSRPASVLTTLENSTNRASGDLVHHQQQLQQLQLQQQQQQHQRHSQIGLESPPPPVPPHKQLNLLHVESAEALRPSTAASTDTFQQAQTLFHDFDGTHYAPSVYEGASGAAGRRASALRHLSGEAPFPPPADGMVYYPAPVPRMLNLPQRLSIGPTSIEQAKRRTQMIQGLSSDARKSATWLMEPGAKPGDRKSTVMEARKSMAHLNGLPPQLRASMFFEHPSQGHEVEVRDQSAVATLEDLLDASTTAPVSAFIDHPFAGPVGSAVYKRRSALRSLSALPEAVDLRDPRRRSSFLGLRRMSISSTDALAADGPKMKGRGSRAFSLGAKLDDLAALSGEKEGDRSGAKTPIFRFGRRGGSDSDSESGREDFPLPPEDDDSAWHGPPTTLLAELQYRKEVQRSRNRTAVEAFPNGMHSTLLELDAVAQIQKQKRMTARVALAWEDPDEFKAAEDAAADDEDVPLGVLYAGNRKVKAQLRERGLADWDRPLGLIEQREREDNEPLSRRRNRLLGFEPSSGRGATPTNMYDLAPSMYITGTDGEEAVESDDEGETLGQRLRRLKDQKDLDEATCDGKARPVSETLSEHEKRKSSSSQGVRDPDAPGGVGSNSPGGVTAQGDSPAGEETLGQRRARLQQLSQAERPQYASGISQGAPPMRRASTGLADLLNSFPAGLSKQPDQNLMGSLHQDGLLKRSEDDRLARREGIRDGNDRRMAGYVNKPLIEVSAPALSGHQKSGGFRGGLYNTGTGGVELGNGTAAGMQSMMDMRQSMYAYGYPATGQMDAMQQAQMMAYQNGYGGAMGTGTGMGMTGYPQMMGMNAYNPNAVTMMNHGGGQQQQQQQHHQYQRHATFAGTMTQQQPVIGEDPLDEKGRARIDAWRQSVQP